MRRTLVLIGREAELRFLKDKYQGNRGRLIVRYDLDEIVQNRDGVQAQNDRNFENATK